MADNTSADSSVSVPVRRVGAGMDTKDTDEVAVEEPMEIRIVYDADGSRKTESISITMRTPGDDSNLAAGFLFTEGIIENAEAIISITPVENKETSASNIIVVELSPNVDVDIARLKRNFYTTSSCGVCGKASLEALSAQSAVPVNGDKLHVDHRVLSGLPDALMQRQDTFSATGGLHAAGLFEPDGAIVDAHEDVGRHNAVDKLVGKALISDSLPFWNMGVIVSGRVSFEIMQKLRMAGCPLVAAVGAPSSLAIELAWEFDMTLVGFLRDARFNVYSGPARIA